MSARPEPPLDALLDAIVEEAQRERLRLEDRAAGRRRALEQDAADHVRALEAAAEDLGRVRGRAAESAVEQEAREEVRRVLEGAEARLADRFLRRVRLALDELPTTDRYAAAIRAWSRAAVPAMSDAAEVFAAPRDLEPIYDALLDAGARDFRVLPDRRIGCGFVVRDLEGRTQFDVRPDALLAAHDAGLRALLAESLPPRPGLERPAGDTPSR